MKSYLRKLFATFLRFEKVSNFAIEAALRDKIAHRIQSEPDFFQLASPHLLRAKQVLESLFPNRQSGVIVDVGAGDGTVSTEIVNLFKCNILYAFEPQRIQFEQIVKKTSVTPSIVPFHCALGSSPSTLELNITRNAGSSSFYVKNEANSNKYYSDSLTKERTEQVEVKTLDSFGFVTEIDLIKLDVQGYEIEVLKGALNTLKRTKLVLLEMQNHDFYLESPKYFDLDTFMRLSGFTFGFHIPMPRSFKINREYEWDALYINDDLRRN